MNEIKMMADCAQTLLAVGSIMTLCAIYLLHRNAENRGHPEVVNGRWETVPHVTTETQKKVDAWAWTLLILSGFAFYFMAMGMAFGIA